MDSRLVGIGLVVAFIVAVGAIFLTWGPSWVGLLATMVLCLTVVAVRRMGFTRSWRDGRTAHAGEAECPLCGSLQTDNLPHFRKDGTEFTRSHCFACDEDFGPERASAA